MRQRKLRAGMVGGGIGASIGPVHRMALALDGEAEVVAGAFSADPQKSRQSAAQIGVTAARAYANPLSAEDAMSALHEWSGKLFCPRLVEQFIVAHGAYPIGSLVELQSGEVAAVVDRQPGNRLQPKLVIMTGPDKGPVRALAEAATRNPDGTPKRIAVRVARSLPAGAFGLRLKDYYLAPG